MVDLNRLNKLDVQLRSGVIGSRRWFPTDHATGEITYAGCSRSFGHETVLWINVKDSKREYKISLSLPLLRELVKRGDAAEIAFGNHLPSCHPHLIDDFHDGAKKV